MDDDVAIDVVADEYATLDSARPRSKTRTTDSESVSTYNSRVSAAYTLPTSLNKSDVDIKTTLQLIVDHQISGLKRAKKIADGDERTIIDRLRANSCSPEQIMKSVTAELLECINFRYETPNASSKRMGGHGWSSRHVHDHMKRFLESKMTIMMNCIRSDETVYLTSDNVWTESLQKAKQRTELIGVSYGGEGLDIDT